MLSPCWLEIVRNAPSPAPQALIACLVIAMGATYLTLLTPAKAKKKIRSTDRED